MSCESKSPHRSWTSTQYLELVVPSMTSFESVRSDGRVTFHLYDEKRRMSAQDEFILYDLRGWIVSFWTVSIWSASSSWSNTWHRSMTTDSWIFCHRWARKIWMSEILSVGICERGRVRVSFFTSFSTATTPTSSRGTYLAVHEDAREVELDLEADVDVGAVDRGCERARSGPCGVRGSRRARGRRVGEREWVREGEECARGCSKSM